MLPSKWICRTVIYNFIVISSTVSEIKNKIHVKSFFYNLPLPSYLKENRIFICILSLVRVHNQYQKYPHCPHYNLKSTKIQRWNCVRFSA